MTTIAYTSGHVAADTGMSAGGSRIGHTVKIVARDGHVAGASGCAGWAASFRKWFVDGEVGPPLTPARNPSGNDEGRGVIFRSDGRIQVLDDGTFGNVTVLRVGAA